ncbi:hypothetical protein [Rothia nasimurium]|uniref:hypothetical protein n=1 Tax=Rothia nasimurium TaxID=85336 RepID=UPI001F322EA5|nr:hypothetical protein [Rothia nasimurium]
MLSTEETLRIPKSRGKSVLIALGLAAIGTWFILYPVDWRIGQSYGYGTLLILGGLGTAINIYRHRYALILTSKGFYDHSSIASHGNHLIPWKVIGDIRADNQAQKIYVDIADTHTYNWTLTGWRALTKVTHDGAENSTIGISTTPMKLPPGMTREGLAEIMRGYRDRASHPPTVEDS